MPSPQLPDLDLLRRAVAPTPGLRAPLVEDAADGALTPAAVLVPIVLRPAAPTLLLTERTAHLRDHAGQVCFPGGRIEAGDASPRAAALRETEEEIGLLPQHVEVIGYLPDYCTGTGFAVTPVVGFVRPPFALHPDSFEVAEVFEVPLAFLLDPANHGEHAIFWRGRERRYHAMPYGRHFIWGATAGMIVSLYRSLTACQA